MFSPSVKRKTISQLPDDILYIIVEKYSDLSSTVALRGTCRDFYHRLPNSIVFSELSIPYNMTSSQLEKFIKHSCSSHNLRYVRRVSVNGSSIDVNSILEILRKSELIQSVSIVGCENFSIPVLMSTLVEWQQDKSGNAPAMTMFKSFLFSRCIVGARNALAIKKINLNLDIINKARSNKQSIFDLTECEDKNCKDCTL
ncbi:668_t:CDS:1, partial [Ambispora leptoticha]